MTGTIAQVVFLVTRGAPPLCGTVVPVAGMRLVCGCEKCRMDDTRAGELRGENPPEHDVY